MFNCTKFTLPKLVVLKNEIKENSGFHLELKSFMGQKDIICSEIVVNNQVYRNGDILIIEITDCDNIYVGLIQTILVKNEKVFFVNKKYKAERNWLQYFESKASESPSVFTESGKLVDFKPLVKRGTTEKFCFMLHHHVSFLYQ
jgi:hypothetical protein